MTQIAKLYIRGSLVNETAKNLTPDQRQQVDKLMQEAWNDPRLENARHEFCQALARTIGGEYADKDFAMNEAWITFWRTAVDTLFHNPKPAVVNNPDVRKKYFQTCMFHYLRQILKENKIPTHLVDRKISGPADVVARDLIKFTLESGLGQKFSIDENEEAATFHAATNLFPLEIMQKLWKLRDEFSEHGVIISIHDSGIRVVGGSAKYVTKKVSERMRVNAVSLSGLEGEDDERGSFQQHCEYQAVKRNEENVDQMTVNDAIDTLRERLPENAKAVFDILRDPPVHFVEKYYPNRKQEVRPKDKDIAQWLNISADEVEAAKQTIREQALAIDLH